MKIYDIIGREITILVNEKLKAGKYEMDFDANNLPSGIYFYKLSVDDLQFAVKRMVLLK